MNCRIYKDEPTKAQREVLKKECVREFDKLLNEYNRQVATQILHILHFDYGFGQQRLKKFADKLKSMQIRQIERYEMSDGDTPWLCRKQLIEDNIDIDNIIGVQNGNESNV